MRFALLSILLAALPAMADTRLALKDGEALTFKVSWAVLPGAGEIKITAQTDTTGPTPRLRVVTTTATRGFARWLLTFDAKAESFFDVKTGRLLSLTESSKQSDKQAEHSVTFDYTTGKALYSTPKSAEPPRPLDLPKGDPMDLITSLVQTRAWDLKVGEKRDMLVLFDDDFYELTIHAARNEEVKTPLGTFHTLVLEPRMDKTEPKGMFKKGSTVRVWIEQDDERRLPVKFEVEFKIGKGVATLTAYEPPAAAKVAEQKPAAVPDAKNPRP